MRRDFEHFGVPAENICAAKEAVKRQTGHELHSYVPTRKEVVTLAAPEITEILIGWMCHSPIEIVPSRFQIVEVRMLLLTRPDFSQLSRIIGMCNNYINNG